MTVPFSVVVTPTRLRVAVLPYDSMLPLNASGGRDARETICSCVIREDNDGSGCSVWDMVVTPEYRRQGFGKAMMMYAFGFAISKNKKLWLRTETENTAAIGLYRSLRPSDMQVNNDRTHFEWSVNRMETMYSFERDVLFRYPFVEDKQ